MEEKGWSALDREVFLRPDATKEFPGTRISGNQHVLAVVNNVAGGRIAEGIRASARNWLLLQHGNRHATGSQVNGRSESAQSAADNNHSLLRAHCRSRSAQEYFRR